MTMPGKIDVFITPPTLEEALHITHTNELVLLDKEPYQGELLLVSPGISLEWLKDVTISPPRANTYVLNMQRIAVEEGKVHLYTNYTTMRSQFTLRQLAPKLMEADRQQALSDMEFGGLSNIDPVNPTGSNSLYLSTRLFRHVMPIGAAMMVETADEQILMEERGKVQIPGKYHPAPAGGCETRDWRVFPELFRCIQGEAWEEIALLPGKDYGDVALIGIARDYTEAFRPVFTYHTKTRWELEKVIQQANSIAPEAGEHQRLFGVPVHPEGLLEFCIAQQEKTIGNGLGALLAFGGYKFGKDWLGSSVQELGKKGSQIVLYTDTFPH